jgi:rhodanese-related sulfurtransferase
MPNAGADSWGILLIRSALNRGIGCLIARVQCTGPAYNLLVEDIKKAAQERGKKMGLTYAGAVLPAEAHKLMQAGAKLVDVRTKPELLYVGKVPGSVAIEWQTYPGSRENPEFIAELAAAVPKDTPVMFLCRSGVRSNAAAEAATRAGWKEAYNILEGFEGDKDANQHRGSVGGWRKAGLPWIQS